MRSFVRSQSQTPISPASSADRISNSGELCWLTLASTEAAIFSISPTSLAATAIAGLFLPKSGDRRMLDPRHVRPFLCPRKPSAGRHGGEARELGRGAVAAVSGVPDV